METSTVIEENVRFPSATSALEGILAYPEEAAPRSAILLLSPHPHMGGRMDNNVIEHLARRFADAGCATLRFNYAGVAGSTLDLPENDSPYEYWARLEETRNYGAVLPDTLAAQRFLSGAVPPETPMIYVGYSFGSCMAIRLAGEIPPARVAAISPPVSRVDIEGLDRLTMPTCFVIGDKDFVYDATRFDAMYEKAPGEKTCVILAGADHFFRKEEQRVYNAIAPFILENQTP